MAWDDYQVRTRAMTPEDVLAVLAEDYRQQAAIGDPFSDLKSLAFETTVHRWLDFDDFPSWHRTSHWLNERFNANISAAAWKRALMPMKNRTLRDVCMLVASAARAPVVEPQVVLGKPCAPAAAFLTLRALLRKRGADVSNLRPSTTIDEFARTRDFPVILELNRLAPGRLPEWKLTWHNDSARIFTVVLLLCGILVAVVGGSLVHLERAAGPGLLGVGTIMALVGYTTHWFTPGPTVTHAKLGDFRTIGDVCRMIAGEG